MGDFGGRWGQTERSSSLAKLNFSHGESSTAQLRELIQAKEGGNGASSMVRSERRKKSSVQGSARAPQARSGSQPAMWGPPPEAHAYLGQGSGAAAAGGDAPRASLVRSFRREGTHHGLGAAGQNGHNNQQEQVHRRASGASRQPPAFDPRTGLDRQHRPHHQQHQQQHQHQHHQQRAASQPVLQFADQSLGSSFAVRVDKPARVALEHHNTERQLQWEREHKRRQKQELEKLRLIKQQEDERRRGEEVERKAREERQRQEAQRRAEEERKRREEEQRRREEAEERERREALAELHRQEQEQAAAEQRAKQAAAAAATAAQQEQLAKQAVPNKPEGGRRGSLWGRGKKDASSGGAAGDNQQQPQQPQGGKSLADMTLVRVKLSQEAIDSCETLFRQFDANGDGVVDAAEFARGLNSLFGRSFSDEDTRKHFAEVEKDEQGHVHFPSFALWVDNFRTVVLRRRKHSLAMQKIQQSEGEQQDAAGAQQRPKAGGGELAVAAPAPAPAPTTPRPTSAQHQTAFVKLCGSDPPHLGLSKERFEQGMRVLSKRPLTRAQVDKVYEQFAEGEERMSLGQFSRYLDKLHSAVEKRASALHAAAEQPQDQQSQQQQQPAPSKGKKAGSLGGADDHDGQGGLGRPTPEQLQRYKAAFQKFDVDGSGGVDVDEFEIGLRIHFAKSVPRGNVEKLFKKIAGGADECDFPHFARWMHRAQQQQQQQQQQQRPTKPA